MRARPTSGSRPEPDLVDVELVDVGHLVTFDSAVLDESRQGQGDAPVSPHRRRGRLVVLAAVTLVVAGSVVANVAEVRAERARRAEIAALPGVLASLDEPLVPRWEQDGWLAGVAGDVALVQAGDGSFRAVAAETGEVVWTRDTAELGEWCFTVGPEATPDEHHFVCLSAQGSDAPVVLTILDAGTGAPIHSLTVPGQHVGFEAVDGDVLLVVARGDGHLRAVRWSPTSGETIWDVTSRDPVVGEDATDLLGWGRSQGVFTVSAVNGEVAFALDTGAEVPVDARAATTWVDTVELADGGTATWEHHERDDGEGTVLDADGSIRFHLPGPVRAPQLDDGSVPGILVAGELDGPTIWGLDSRTGEDLWSRKAPGAWPLLVLEGRMLLAGGPGLLMIDLRDGTEVWSTEGGSEYWQGPLTDGDTVLLLERDGVRPVLVARLLSDGSEVWRTSVPPTTYGAAPTGSGQVLLHTESAVVGLG